MCESGVAERGEVKDEVTDEEKGEKMNLWTQLPVGLP
jgi:hypothetical protein